MKITRLICLLFLSVFLFSSCKQGYKEISFFAMNTFILAQADCEDTAVLQAIEKEIYSDEKRFSKTIPDSDISRLNCKEAFTPSAEAISLIEYALEISEATDYAFSPFLGKISSLWDITGDNPTVPSKTELEEIVADIKKQKITLENFSSTSQNVQLDLGGIVKGYSAQKAIENLKASKVENALISFGGSVACMGKNESGRLFTIGIKNPFDKNEIIGTLTLSDSYISVSGAYERFFEKDGVRYHHIFDSETGYPAESDIESTVVISKDGILSDALSTALFVMGKEKALEFYKKDLYDFEMLLVTKDGEICITDGIYDSFSQSSSATGIKSNAIFIIKK